ncbi:MAG: hypothetical protein WAL61_02145 [Acidimicrobiales bacterium]
MTQVFGRARRGVALVPLVLVLAGCSSGGSGPQSGGNADGSLRSADKAVQTAMQTYLSAVAACAKESTPVVCLETADRALGDKIHTYANLLARHQKVTAPQADVTAALNSAQTLANSLEILGDAQPTQANYNQVLNTFNVNSAITQLQGQVGALNGSLS